jgi:phosphatidylserine/phosphatidylglycerophosphate/cardiolipin synthase-like enzyme
MTRRFRIWLIVALGAVALALCCLVIFVIVPAGIFGNSTVETNVRPARTGETTGAEHPSRTANPRPTAVPGPAVAGLIVEPDEGTGPIVQEIAQAKRSVDLVIYLLSDRDIITALKAARARGLTVRVMMEEHPYGGGSGNGGVAKDLQSAGITTAWSNPVFKLTHQKTLVVDESRAVIMTLNLTASAFSRNREFAIVDTDAGQVQEIEQVFNADWNRQKVTPANPALVWSPDNSRTKTINVIKGAKKTLLIYNEEMQDTATQQAIVDASRRGVQVRVLMTGAEEGDDPNEPGRQQIAGAGAEVRLISTPYIHAKMILADAGESGASAFVGSENISTASLNGNRELGILLQDATQLNRLKTTFEHDWARAR